MNLRIYAGLLALLTVFGAGAAQSADYPSNTVRFIVPFAAGGGADIVGRLVAAQLTSIWPHSVIVENRDGAGGNIGAEVVAHAPPDGLTLLFTTQGPLVVNQSLYAHLPYDPDAMVAVSYVASSANVLVVNPKVPAKDMKSLIAYAQANPGKLNYASQGIGTTAHLAAEMLKSTAHLDITHVPYKGTGPALTDLMGGQIDMMFAEMSAAAPYIKSAKLQPIALGSPDRSKTFPEIAPASETLPGFTVTTWYAIMAPPGTPAEIVAKVSQDVAAILRKPDVSARLEGLNVTPVGGDPVALKAQIKSERARWGKVVQDAGILAR